MPPGDRTNLGITRSITHQTIHEILPGINNTEADDTSRAFSDVGEWELDNNTLHNIFTAFGQQSIDMFATDKNKKAENLMQNTQMR